MLRIPNAVLQPEAVDARRGFSGLGRGNLDHGPGLELRGFQPAVERAEFGLRDPEAARKRIERLARMDDVVGRALFGHTVERLAILLPLLLRAGFVLRTDLFLADQDTFAEAHVQRIEIRVVLQNGLHRNLVLPRNGIERFALRDKMEIEGLAQFLIRFGLGNIGHKGNLDVLGGFQAAGDRRVVFENHFLAHPVGFRKSVECLARLHRVDVILRSVDVDDRLGLLGRQGAEAPRDHQECGKESFHRHFVFSRIRISVMTFLV